MAKSMKKRYLIVLTDLNVGGVTTAAINLCNCLTEHGNFVDVLVMSSLRASNEPDLGEQVNILQLKGKDRLWNLNKQMIDSENRPLAKFLLLCLGFIKKLINTKSKWIRLLFGKKIRFSGYDMAIAYRQCAPCYHFVLNCVEATKKVGFVHGDINFMGDISTWYRYMHDFDAIAYVSNAVKQGFINKHNDLTNNAITVYNVFDNDSIIQKSRIPCDFEFDKSVINIVTVSRIENDIKGTGRIPYICKMLKDSYKGQFHWYLVGDGPDMESLKQKIDSLSLSDHFTFVGQQSNPYNILVQADMCIFPTFTEAFPMVVGEGLILGVPIVTTRYPAVEEIIVDNYNGLIAEQSVESIFEKLSCLFEDRNMLEQLKKNCSGYIYDNERSYNQLIDVMIK